jgi:ribose 1,5-bisphosphokinase PhnN
MRNRTQEQYLKISVFVITLVMIVLRFLLNEKGRITPDSIRFMRQAHVFPEIVNTTAPLLYPLFIKVFNVFTDEFW